MGALVAVWLCAAGAPTAASAFQGEQSVVTETSSGTPTLTPQAETLITNPTFLTEEPTAAAAIGEGSAPIFAAESAGMIPLLSGALPWVAGGTVAAIGAVSICNSIFGDCLDVFGLGSDPPKPATWTWSLSTTVKNVSVGTAGAGIGIQSIRVWQGTYTTEGAITEADYEEACAGKKAGHENLPGPPVRTLKGGELLECGGVLGLQVGTRRLGYFNPASNRGIADGGSQIPDHTLYAGSNYCSSTTSCSSASPSTKWPEQYAHCLVSPGDCGLSAAEANHLGEHLASAMQGSEVTDPYKLYVAVPECDGLYWSECKSVLEEAQLVPSRKDVGFNGADVSLPAGAVLTVTPSTGTQVHTKSTVTVKTNPDTMPVVLPQPLPGETGEQYKARVQQLDPNAVVSLITLETADPAYGPSEVTGATPAFGTRLDPKSKTEVHVNQNPATAPAVAGAGGSGGCGASVGAINWTPLNQPLGSKFPFGVFGFFVGWVGKWSVNTAAPEWTVTVLPAGVFGSKEGLHIHVSFSKLLPVFEAVRVAFLFASFVGLLWFLGTAAMKAQGDSS